MAEKEQITVRFESTLDNELAEDNSLLLSGPVEVQLVVDTFSELFGDECVTTLKENLNTESFIVAYVKDVSGYTGQTLNAMSESPLHRGTYFYLKGWSDADQTIPNWVEILLGTHSHPNLDKLNLLAARLDEDGNLPTEKDKDSEVILQLPKLPPEITDRLMKHKTTVKIKGIGLESDGNNKEHYHVFGPDYYDWCGPNEVGQYKNLDVITHNELYRRLRGDTVSLKLKEIDSSLPDIAVQLAEFPVNLSLEKVDGYINAVKSNTSDNLLISLNLPWEPRKGEQFFFFKGIDNNYHLEDYEIVSTNKKEMILEVSRPEEGKPTLETLTVLKADPNTLAKEDLAAQFTPDLIQKINTGLRIRYIEGAVEETFELPRLYLSTDKDGNLEWSNALLPAQHFIYREKKFTAEEMQSLNSDTLTVKFEDTNYNAATDFPLLLVNSSFIFNAKYEVEEIDREHNKFALVCKIPTENENIVERSYEEIGADVKLILIRKTSAEAIADTVAQNYISKKDAISILSRGKLNLDDYATRDELNAFAKKMHTHTEYSLKGHNHDYRYANYHHTHPELAALIYHISQGEVTEDNVNQWMDQIANSRINDLIAFVEGELDLTKYNDHYTIKDNNVKLTSDLIENFNSTLNTLHIDIEPLTQTAYLYDAILKLLEIFRLDTVNANQVLLDRDIPVKIGIGGAKKGSIFRKNIKLQELLEELLNPYIPVDVPADDESRSTLKLLTPVPEKTEFKWYKGENHEEFDPTNIQYDPTASNVYFRIILKNIYDEPCEAEYTITDDPTDPNYGQSFITKVLPVYNGVGQLEGDYLLFKENYHFDSTTFEDIKYRWTVNNETNRIYDNYGTSPTIMEVPSEDIIDNQMFRVNLPDFLYGTYSNNDSPIDADRESKLLLPDAKNEIITSITADVGDRLVILLEDGFSIEDDLIILDINNHMEIQDYFEEGTPVTMFGNVSYNNYYYTLGANTDEIKLLIKLKEHKE